MLQALGLDQNPASGEVIQKRRAQQRCDAGVALQPLGGGLDHFKG
jgi:hypothetical protein